MTRKMVAPGGWSVEAINLGGRPAYRVKRRGRLAGRGYYADPRDVREVMGDKFVLLVPAIA